jgi:hypothetical protein
VKPIKAVFASTWVSSSIRAKVSRDNVGRSFGSEGNGEAWTALDVPIQSSGRAGAVVPTIAVCTSDPKETNQLIKG